MSGKWATGTHLHTLSLTQGSVQRPNTSRPGGRIVRRPGSGSPKAPHSSIFWGHLRAPEVPENRLGKRRTGHSGALQSRLHRFDSGRRLYAFANAVSEDEAKELYHTFAVPAPGAPLFQAATANLNPWTEAKVDTKNPDRGPLLIIDGEQDHTVPWAIANASFKKQQRNKGVTEIVAIPDRGHALTIDSGWRVVADTALEFVKRFV
jgi:pimeloyl-ACP methyl ester carboxylesterase